MSETSVELKTCEGCGALWLRAKNAGVYCMGCRCKLEELPAASRHRRRRMRRAPSVDSVAVLPVVHAVAADYTRLGIRQDPVVFLPAPAPLPKPDASMKFYRKYTEALLRRYQRLSMQVGRSSGLLGREVMTGSVSHCKVAGFDDMIAFCVDLERCATRLHGRERELIRKIALQEYTYAEAAGLVGMPLRSAIRQYGQALDTLTEMLLECGMLHPLCGLPGQA